MRNRRPNISNTNANNNRTTIGKTRRLILPKQPLSTATTTPPGLTNRHEINPTIPTTTYKSGHEQQLLPAAIRGRNRRRHRSNLEHSPDANTSRTVRREWQFDGHWNSDHSSPQIHVSAGSPTPVALSTSLAVLPHGRRRDGNGVRNAVRREPLYEPASRVCSVLGTRLGGALLLLDPVYLLDVRY